MSLASLTALLAAATAPAASLEVRAVSPAVGKGVFALEAVDADAVLLRTAPLVSLQHRTNKALYCVCEHCLRPLQPLAALAPVTDGAFQLPATAHTARLSPSAVPCSQNCGELYCSDQCRSRAWLLHHRWLCVAALSSEEDSLYQFKLHSLQTNEAFLLAAKLLLSCRADPLVSAVTKEMLGRPWHEVVLNPSDSEMTDAEWSASLFEMATQSSELLFKAIPRVEAFEELRASMLHLMGMFELNNHELELDSQVQRALDRHYSSLPAAEQATLAAHLRTFLTELFQADSDFGDAAELVDLAWPQLLAHLAEILPPVEGTALTPLIASLNHSCCPNVFVRNPGTSHGIELVAYRRILPGEQLFISYIDQTLPVEERQEQLLDHRFVCSCASCLQESR